MESIKGLGQKFEDLQGRHNALLEKGVEFTAEDDVAARQLQGEMGLVKAQIESLRRLDPHRVTANQYEEWSRASAGAPLLELPPGVQHNGVSFLGMVPAGQSMFGTSVAGLPTVLELDQKGKVDQNFRAGAFQAAAKPEYGQAWRKSLTPKWADATNAEQAVLQEGIDSDGGYLAPEEIMTRVIQRAPTPTRLRGMVTEIPTSKDAINWPKVVYSTDDLYTTGMRVTWTGEIPASSTAHRATQPVFGQVRVPIYTAMMSLPVTQDLLDDAAFPLEAWLSSKFAETIDLLIDNMILNGTGVGQPSGILVNPNATDNPATIVSGSASALTGDGLLNLTESLPEQYDDGSARLIFNKTNTGKAIRLLKDGDGRPLVTYGFSDNGLGSGRYKQVNGYDYSWSGFMPNVGANTYPIIFGDLKGYLLAMRLGFSIRVLREIEALSNQVVLLARVRFGGMATEPWRLRIQKVAAS